MLVGHPILIEDPKYERNALLFNLCLLTDVYDADKYTAAVTNLAGHLELLERDIEFVSQHPPAMQNFLATLVSELNAYSQSCVTLHQFPITVVSQHV